MDDATQLLMRQVIDGQTRLHDLTSMVGERLMHNGDPQFEHGLGKLDHFAEQLNRSIGSRQTAGNTTAHVLAPGVTGLALGNTLPLPIFVPYGQTFPRG